MIQGCRRFSVNSVGMLVADSGGIHGNHCQQRAKLMKACAVQTWRLLIIILLNGESVNWSTEKPFVRCKLNASQQEALRNLTSRCEAFCSSPLAEFKVGDFSEIIRTKAIDYSGEEVTYALPLKLEELLPGLPDSGIAGTLESSEVADEEVRGWLLHPEVALKPPVDWPVRVPQAKINTSKPEWYRICAVLFERGILAPIKKEDIFAVEGVPVLNGAFAVEKKGEPLPGQSRITRLIMNMVPSNSYQLLQKGDLPTLASSTGWAGVVLESHQALLWSGDRKVLSTLGVFLLRGGPSWLFVGRFLGPVLAGPRRIGCSCVRLSFQWAGCRQFLCFSIYIDSLGLRRITLKRRSGDEIGPFL